MPILRTVWRRRALINLQVWAVGERVHARLADAGLPLLGLFNVPNSVQAITPLVGQI
jgi:F-type H+-transporting ATPase subunit gamma